MKPVPLALAFLLTITLAPAPGSADEPASSETIVRMVGDAIYVQPKCEPDPGDPWSCTDVFGSVRCRPGPDGPAVDQPPAPSVHLDGCYFAPAEVHARVGDTITWVSDAFVSPHKVTTHVAPAVIDSGPLGPGMTFSFTLPLPGVYEYHCAMHGPDMGEGVIVVDP